MKVTQNPTPNASSLATKGTEKTIEKAIGPMKGNEAANSVALGRQGADVEISDAARLMKKANELAMSAPDIRADKVASLKKAIQGGTYKIDAAAIADRLVDEHLATDLEPNA